MTFFSLSNIVKHIKTQSLASETISSRATKHYLLNLLKQQKKGTRMRKKPNALFETMIGWGGFTADYVTYETTERTTEIETEKNITKKQTHHLQFHSVIANTSNCFYCLSRKIQFNALSASIRKGRDRKNMNPLSFFRPF